jgi:hypothetical protein
VVQSTRGGVIPKWGPEAIGGTLDDVAARAKQAGGKFTDPFGHLWWIASRKENLSPEEQQRRAAEMHESQPAS